MVKRPECHEFPGQQPLSGHGKNTQVRQNASARNYYQSARDHANDAWYPDPDWQGDADVRIQSTQIQCSPADKSNGDGYLNHSPQSER